MFFLSHLDWTMLPEKQFPYYLMRHQAASGWSWTMRNRGKCPTRVKCSKRSFQLRPHLIDPESFRRSMNQANLSSHGIPFVPSNKLMSWHLNSPNDLPRRNITFYAFSMFLLFFFWYNFHMNVKYACHI